MRPSAWPSARRRTPTSSRGTFISYPECAGTALTEEAKRRPPNIPPLPASFQHFRSELGAQVYGAMGIGPQDTEKHAAAVMRNWEFFRAPLACVVCMHRDLGPWDAMSVGMFLQASNS